MTVIWLLAAFAAFMGMIWSVYALNRMSMMRHGSEPFSLPNAALMLVVNLLLFSVLSGGIAQSDAVVSFAANDPAVLTKLGIAAALSLWLFVVIARRTSAWIALVAVPLMAVGAIAILPSLVFRYLALIDGEPGPS